MDKFPLFGRNSTSSSASVLPGKKSSVLSSNVLFDFHTPYLKLDTIFSSKLALRIASFDTIFSSKLTLRIASFDGRTLIECAMEMIDISNVEFGFSYHKL